MDQLLTVNEAAEVLRYTPRSIWEGIRTGAIPSTRIARKVFVRASILDRIMAEGIPAGSLWKRPAKADESKA